MPELSGCPWRDELHQMVMGKVRGTRAQTIAQHVDTCAMCLDALRQWIVSDEIVEAAHAGRAPNSEPTKTMYLPLGQIRDALATWRVTRDDTRADHDALPPSLAEFKTVLSPPQSTDEIGRIADFRVLRLLGIGGMAAVFEAEDTRLKRQVAVKVLHPSIAARPGAKDRFLREAQNAAALKHEHIVTIHQVGLHGETPFLVLELLHGETLEDRLVRAGRLSVPQIVRIGREIAEGLAAAHAQGLLHRDIKPANVWLEGPPLPNRDQSTMPNNGPVDAAALAGRVKILDFGLAKLWSAEPDTSTAGMVIGTPRYMAPEQVTGGAVDPRTDLFSLGCVLYRMATGRAPFGGSDLLSVLRALACEEPPPARVLNPQVPAALSDLIGQLISKSPDKRPPSAQVVAHRLQSIADDLAAGSGVVGLAGGPAKGERPGHRGRGVTWLLGTAIALAALLPLGYFFGAQVIRIATNRGQVVIQIDDPRVEVTIQENRVAILDQPGQREITLAAGEHELEVTVKEASREETFTTDRFTLSRGGRKVIDVREELAKASTTGRVAAPSSLAGGTGGPAGEAHSEHLAAGTDRYRRAAQWALSLGGSVIVQVHNRAEPLEVRAGTALPTGDFELKQISLRARPVTDAGLDELAGLTSLNELFLSGTPISDAGLARLRGLTGLQHLLLDGTPVTDAGLANIRGLKSLRFLVLNWSKVADSGLANLEGLTELRVLHLRGTQVTDAGLEHLRPLTKLETLGVSRLPLTDTGLVPLQSLKRLRWLDLGSTGVTDAGLAHLRTLKDLQYLALNGTAVTDAGLANLEPLTNLDSLDLGQLQITDAGLEHLRGLERLSDLCLRGSRRVGDFAIPRLLRFSRLQSIDLSDTHVSAKGLALLKASLPSGAHVAWTEPNDVAARAVLAAGGRVDVRVQGAAEDHLVKAVSDIPAASFRITAVSLSGVRQPLKAVFDALKNPGVEALGSLDLSDTTITDGDLASLKGLTHLNRLVLDGAKIEGRGLPDLQDLPELRELRLGCPKLIEVFLVEIAGLKKLEKLSLAKSQIADEGVRQLAKLTHLKELDLTETKVTAAGVAELQKSLPGCRILTIAAHR